MDGGRLLIFGGIDNRVLKEGLLYEFIILTFFKVDNEVDVGLHFPERNNEVVECVYAFVRSHCSELSIIL